MAKMNQCDVLCPRRAYIEAHYRESAAEASPTEKIALAAEVTVSGLAQMLRAATCPQRNAQQEPWPPNQACADAAQEAFVERPLAPEHLTPIERTVLDPYINPQ